MTHRPGHDPRPLCRHLRVSVEDRERFYRSGTKCPGFPFLFLYVPKTHVLYTVYESIVTRTSKVWYFYLSRFPTRFLFPRIGLRSSPVPSENLSHPDESSSRLTLVLTSTGLLSLSGFPDDDEDLGITFRPFGNSGLSLPRGPWWSRLSLNSRLLRWDRGRVRPSGSTHPQTPDSFDVHPFHLWKV